MKNRISSIMDTGRKKTGSAILCCVLILTLGTGMAFAAQSPPKSNPSGSTDDAYLNATQIVENTLMSHTDPITGKTYYSWDLGKTWTPLTNAEYDAMFPKPVVEWWTYDEYKVWMNEQIKSLQALADDGLSDYYDKDGVPRDFTQADVDEAAALYQSILENIKKGFRVSKTVDGSTDTVISYDPRDIDTVREDGAATGTTYAVGGNSWSDNNADQNYDEYAKFGISYRDNKLYYNGEPVRCFDDWYLLGENMYAGRSYFDKDGIIDIFAQRDFSQIVHNPDGSYDPSGKLVGVKASSQAEFDARDIEALINPSSLQAATSAVNSTGYTSDASQGNGNATATYTAVTVQSTDGSVPSEVGKSFEKIFEAYADYGITFDTNSKNGGVGNVYYNGQLVKRFVDVRPDGGVTSVTSADGGKLTVRTVYDTNGKLSGTKVTEE